MKIYCLMVFLMFSCQKKTASNDPVDLSRLYKISSSYDEKSKLLVIKVELSEGLYAYGQKEKIGKPVNFKILEKNGWSSDGPLIFPHVSGTLIKNTFTISQKLHQGVGSGEGIFYLQVCTKDLCDMPKEHKIFVR